MGKPAAGFCDAKTPTATTQVRNTMKARQPHAAINAAPSVLPKSPLEQPPADHKGPLHRGGRALRELPQGRAAAKFIFSAVAYCPAMCHSMPANTPCDNLYSLAKTLLQISSKWGQKKPPNGVKRSPQMGSKEAPKWGQNVRDKPPRAANGVKRSPQMGSKEAPPGC